MTPYVAGRRQTGAIKLSSNENPLGCSPAAVQAIRTAAEEAHIYPDGGARTLRTTIGETLGLSPEHVITGNGSDEVLTMIAATYLNPGDPVLIAEHTFSQYEFAARLLDADVRRIPMRDLHYDLGAFSRNMAGARILFLCSPNNPTGLVIPDGELRTFLEDVPRDVLVVVDHAYIEYQSASGAGCDATRLVEEYPNLVVLRTFSKIHGLAAVRVGYGIATPARIAELERVRSPFNVNSIAQIAATAALGDRTFLERSLEKNREGAHRMYRFFGELGIEFLPTEANFVTIRVPSPGMKDAGSQDVEPRPDTGRQDAAQWAEALTDHGVTVRPLGSFGLPDHLRITIGSPDQIDVLEAAFREISPSL